MNFKVWSIELKPIGKIISWNLEIYIKNVNRS